MSKDNTLDERIEEILADIVVQTGASLNSNHLEAIKSLIAEERRKAKIEVIEKLKFTLDRLDDELEQEDERENNENI